MIVDISETRPPVMSGRRLDLSSIDERSDRRRGACQPIESGPSVDATGHALGRPVSAKISRCASGR